MEKTFFANENCVVQGHAVCRYYSKEGLQLMMSSIVHNVEEGRIRTYINREACLYLYQNSFKPT